MKHKNLIGFFSLLFCVLCFVKCSDEEEREDKVEIIKMSVSEKPVVIYPKGTYGSMECMLVKEEKENEYFSLDFTDIADFDYERGYSYELLVEKTSLANSPVNAASVEYKLMEILSRTTTVSEYGVETLYKIDAEIESLIEEDLLHNLPVPIGGNYLLNRDTVYNEILSYPISIIDKNKNVLREGVFQELMLTDIGMESPYPDSYKLFEPDSKVVTTRCWAFIFDENRSVYDVFMVYSDVPVPMTAHPWLYEDLTRHYQTKFPDAGVRGVVRVQVLTYNPSFGNS